MDQPAPPGLTSEIAQRRLHQQVLTFAASHRRMHWLKELSRPPYTALTSLFILSTGLLIIIDFAVSAHEQRRDVWFQGLVLLILAVFSLAQYCWEVYILRTRRVRQLLSKIHPFLGSPCPWTPSSYPKQSITSLRGHFTVHAYRDGKVVNLPTSLLVKGDVIQLQEGVVSPAKVRLLVSDSTASKMAEEDICIEAGKAPPPEIFVEHQRVTTGDSIVFTPLATAQNFVVMETPVISILESNIGRKRSKSFLTREKDMALIILNIMTIAAFILSIIVNGIRYAVLKDDLGTGTELLLRQQVYNVLPLFHLPLPILWTLVNLYGTARIVLLVHHGPAFFDGKKGLEHVWKVWLTFKQMLLILRWPSLFPNYRAFHILGTLTSFCAIDKEYVLTSSSPTPEKLFFLRCSKTPDENISMNEREKEEAEKEGQTEEKEEEEEVGTEREMEEQRENEEEKKEEEEERETEKEKIEEEEERETEEEEEREKMGTESHTASLEQQLQVEIDMEPLLPSKKFFVEDVEGDREKTTEGSTKQDNPSIGSPADAEQSLNRSDSIEEVKVEVKEKTGELLKPPAGQSMISGDSVSAVSTISDATPFEVITEILDISKNPNSESGLGFDDINWETHLGSLKPIGVNVLATSHLLSDPYEWCPYGSTEELRMVLRNTTCMCPLGMEIGVMEFSESQFSRELLLYSVGGSPQQVIRNTLRRKTSTSVFPSVQNVQPHIISAVLQNSITDNYLIMSCGSGDMVASCCSDFWDGMDLQPMTDLERDTITDFFNRRSLTAYCVALAYNPLLDLNLKPLKSHNLSIFVPNEHIKKNFSDISMLSMLGYDSESGPNGVETKVPTLTPSSPADKVFSSLQCNQVFLGMVSLQFQPKRDIVTLIEDLETAGIRFVHFTAEDEVRGKIFAEKLGLEAGWNCHISLAPGDGDDDDLTSESEKGFGGSNATSACSSLSSVINAYQAYIRAKLPKGIDRIRPHINNVDNVPLLVPLFTDCTTDTIREMVEIMQENGEVVMCLGNSWNTDNLKVFSQADISIAVIPENMESSECLTKASEVNDPDSSLSRPQFGTRSDHSSPQGCSPTWPQPLEMASYLNSTTCQLSFSRSRNVSISSLVTESRHIMSCIRRGLLFALGASLALSFLMILATVLFLPPPLAGHHLFWVLLFPVPVLTLSYLSSPIDFNIKSQMPNRKRMVWDGKCWFLINFIITFASTAGWCLLLFALTLGGVCSRDIPNSSCHPLLGNWNDSGNVSSWSGWSGDSEQGLLFSQDLTAFFFTCYLIVLSLRFVHRTEPIMKLWKFIPWQYVLVAVSIIPLQIIYFAVSQIVATEAYDINVIAYPSSVPFYVWVLGFGWPVALVLLQEVLKYHDKRMFVRKQKHLKLEFGTKLGMNSPF